MKKLIDPRLIKIAEGLGVTVDYEAGIALWYAAQYNTQTNVISMYDDNNKTPKNLILAHEIGHAIGTLGKFPYRTGEQQGKLDIPVSTAMRYNTEIAVQIFAQELLILLGLDTDETYYFTKIYLDNCRETLRVLGLGLDDDVISQYRDRLNVVIERGLI
jgi:hypothetical protein